MSAPLPVALLGAGIFARECHLPAILSNPATSLAAIYSRSLSSAQKALSDVPSLSSIDPSTVPLYSDDSDASRSLDALLARDDVKAVVVALPILTQPEVIKKCILAGKHVLSEKPVAPTVKDAEELLEWYNANSDNGSTIWSVAENFRYQSHYQEALAEARRLGGVKSVEVRVLAGVEKGGKYYETEWRKVPGYQGGFCLDGGVHFAAALRLLLPKHHEFTVASFTQLLQEHLPPIDTIRSVWASTPKTVTAEDQPITGTFNLSFGASSVRDYSYTIDTPNGVIVVGGDKFVVKETGKEEVEKKNTNDPRGISGELTAFVDAIKEGIKGGAYEQSVQLAIGDLEIIENMLKSGEEGGKPIKMRYFSQL